MVLSAPFRRLSKKLGESMGAVNQKPDLSSLLDRVDTASAELNIESL
jgi:hypothetical protein